MIVFDLKCRKGHVFEAWFSDTAAFEKLRKAQHVACVICGSTKVDKGLSAPRVSTRKGKKSGAPEQRQIAEDTRPTPALGDRAQVATGPMAPQAAALARQLSELRGQIEKNCDYVGNQFPEEARKIHYGEAPKRNIYGEATEADARALSDEGVEFARIPWAPRRDA